MLVGYSLPWLTSPGTGLTFGAYDLAEWTSLHPNVQSEQPTLLTTVLLRSPLVWSAWLIALAPFMSRLLRASAIILIAGALLPPIEFFTTYQSNTNYQQLLLVAVITVIATIPTMQVRNARPIWFFVVSVLSCASAVIGYANAYNLISAFQLPVNMGMGFIITVVGMITTGIILIKTN